MVAKILTGKEIFMVLEFSRNAKIPLMKIYFSNIYILDYYGNPLRLGTQTSFGRRTNVTSLVTTWAGGTRTIPFSLFD